MIPLVVLGAGGRMGRAVAETAAADAGFHLKAGVDRSARIPGFAAWGERIEEFLAAGDVVVDFSDRSGTLEAAKACAARRASLVSGTTGLAEGDEQALRAAATQVAVLRAANFSLGVLALRRALSAALATLPDWDIEIVERHHRGKQDSPSGTALQLARESAEIRGYPESALRHGRVGRVGTRAAKEIGIHAVRGGSWVGDHTVLLAGPGEWVEVRHVAQDRTAFAHGALAAARFVASAGPGFYTLDDVTKAAAT